LKGRPSGTPKSEDPNKKKRKRVARGRGLCDVKIKTTECLPSTPSTKILAHIRQQKQLDCATRTGSSLPLQTQDPSFQEPLSAWCPPVSTLSIPVDQPVSSVEQGHCRLCTVQRINGLGANGPTDSNPGHKHTLEDSDRVKKNSVIRWMLNSEKERKQSG